MGARLDASGVSRAPRMPKLNVRAVLQLRHERKALIGKGKKKKTHKGRHEQDSRCREVSEEIQAVKMDGIRANSPQRVSAKAAGCGSGWIGNGKGVGGEQASR